MDKNGSGRQEPRIDMNILEVEVQRALVDFKTSSTDERVQAAGRLSAESVKHEYELASKAIMDMGTEVVDRVEKLEAALVECDKDMRLIAEAAAFIKERGKMVYTQIAEASALSKEIRDACAAAREKIGN